MALAGPIMNQVVLVMKNVTSVCAASKAWSNKFSGIRIAVAGTIPD